MLRKNQLPEQVLQLPMIAGLAVMRAVISTGMPRGRVGLKWPNDLVIGDSWENAHKVAGVLIESSSQGAQTSYAVVGVGINVNHSVEELPQIEPPSLPPTSLALELGSVVDCTDLLIAFCRHMADLLTLPSPMLAAAWSSALWNLHRQVTVTLPEGGHLFGTALGVNEHGSLIVEHDGRTTIVSTGDISIRPSG
jgi:BirA family biotin operon repressor/biotin-[acetyl-CoA-carboxylase] ligase